LRVGQTNLLGRADAAGPPVRLCPLEERAGVCAASDGAIPRDSALANKEKNGTVIVRKFVRG